MSPHQRQGGFLLGPPHSGWGPPWGSSNDLGIPLAQGAGPFPSRTGCAGGVQLGVRVPHPGSPAVVGPSPCPGPGGRRKPAAAPDRVRPSVRPSAAARRRLFARLSLKLTVGTPGSHRSGAGLEVSGCAAVGGSQLAPTALSPPTFCCGRGSGWGAELSPTGAPRFWDRGSHSRILPEQALWGSGAQRGVLGELGSSPTPALGPPAAHLPPIKGCFSSRAPDLPRICSNLAGNVRWPGRHRLPDAAGREQGGLPAGSPIWGLGSCILGEHWRVFAGVVVSVPSLKHHQDVPTLLPPPSSSIPGGFGVTLRGAATGTGNHRCPLTHCPSPARTPWVGWGCCHPPKGGPGGTVAVPAGVQSHPRQRERVRIRPVWLRRPLHRLILPSPLNRAVPRAAPPGAPRSPGRGLGWWVPPASPRCQLGGLSPASESGHVVTGREFLGKVPAGGTRLRQGRPRCLRVPLAWFCRPALWTPWGHHGGGPCGAELHPAHPSGGIHTLGGWFRVGDPFPKVPVGCGVSCASSDLPRPLVWLLGLVCFEVSGGNG